MLQVVRDEAHRFANTFHRQQRSKRMRASELDGVRGLGAARKERLIKQFGGIAGIKQASREALHELTWLPGAVADAVYDRFNGAR
jgi:excinuclease ABC subunit C